MVAKRFHENVNVRKYILLYWLAFILEIWFTYKMRDVKVNMQLIERRILENLIRRSHRNVN